MLLRIRHLGALAALTLAFSTTALRAQASEDKTPLGKKMSAMNAAFRTIGQQVADSSKNASTLEQITIFETNAKEALAFEPEKKAQIPAPEQEKFVADFKSGLEKLIETAAKLHEAMAAGKNTDAAAIVDDMRRLQRESHQVFRIRRPPPGV
jgi:soluble cytochrome b562